MATFTYVPDFPLDAETQGRVLEARFGDGYRQQVPDGLNTTLPVYRLAFRQRTSTEAGNIETFLKANLGAIFDWTPPGLAAGKFVCSQWTRSRANALFENVTAVFEQVPG